jgi:hypothetical protein
MIKWVVRTAIVASVFLMLAGTTALADNGCPPEGASFFVPATAGGGTEAMGGTDWFDSGIALNGESVAISASGTWSDCGETSADCGATPDGSGVTRIKGCRFIAPHLSAGGLIARVGDGTMVFIGTGPTTLSGTGSVRFAINDCFFGDNEGGFTVTMMPAE